MPEDELTDSESDEGSQSSSADEPGSPPNAASQRVTEYEKLRLSRIRDNKARLEALGLPKMATSLMGVGQKEGRIRGKGKGKMTMDEEYRPPENEDGLSSSSVGDDDDDEEPSGSRSRKMAKTKGSKPKKKVPIQKILDNSDVIDDDDDALMKAIALSLKDSMEVKSSGVPSYSPNAPNEGGFDERKGSCNIQEDVGKRKRKKPINSRVQMTEDELILHFFQLDEVGKGNITLKDLQRIATAHDFTWTEKEMADMIHCFDTDGDGKLDLDDFRKIVGRCNMIQGSETL